MKTRTVIGRAELVELELDDAQPTEDQLSRASMLGFHWAKSATENQTDSDEVLVNNKALSPVITPTKDIRLEPVVFYRPERFRELSPDRNKEQVTTQTGISPKWLNKPRDLPSAKRLPAPQEILAKLSNILSFQRDSRRLDLPRYTRQLAQLEAHGKIPRRKTRLSPTSMQIVIDRSVRLTPMWNDQDYFVQQLLESMPGLHLQIYVYLEAEGELIDPIDFSRKETFDSADGPVLVLSDLGANDNDIQFWIKVGASIKAEGGVAAAMLPSRATSLSEKQASFWRCAPWDESVPFVEETDRAVELLLTLLAPAIRIEPELLRAMRVTLLPESSVAAEVLFWDSSALSSFHSVAATMSAEARKDYRKKFKSLGASLNGQSIARDALSIIRQWRANCPDEIWYEEIVDLPESMHSLLDPNDIEHAFSYYRSLDNDLGAPGSQEPDLDQLAWLRRNGKRLHLDGGMAHTEVRNVVQRAFKDIPEQAPLTGPGKGPLIGKPVGSVSLRQNGANVVASADAFARGSVMALLPTDDGEIECIEFASPAWANKIGTDAYGSWAEIEVGGVVQRLRYIPAGSFVIGSPEDESGRWDDESPQSNISFEEGFWLFDTAVTNAFWNAVMGGENVLETDRDLPKVEVSWDDVQEFFFCLNNAKPHLFLRLPSEAEWEYGCRAGTTTPFFFGTTAKPEEINFSEGLIGVCSVKSRPPNTWGLFQMHGNVDEWCADIWSESHESINSDGSARTRGSEKRTARVVRGGSWDFNARFVRAAARVRSESGDRGGGLGFRCVPGQAESVDRDDRRREGREAEPSTAMRIKQHIRISKTQANKISIPTGSFALRSDRAELEFARITKSDLGWASALGRDEYGLWATLTIRGVEVPFRWIPPGQCMIGSPAEEPGYAAVVKEFEIYRGYEDPQTQITLAQGYWFMDAPVTQALWEAVMGDNPSGFKSPDRPVEQVSLDDVGEFLSMLNKALTGASLRLPSESEWEYACRAGSEEATYAGSMQILGKNNAPVLDGIAWYGGNSGEGFELENGHDSSGWDEKQYDHKVAGSHPVRMKRPNNWGCYDLLGNVLEWCEDVWFESHDGIDQAGAARRGESNLKEGARVVRGGSWNFSARGVRAACRDGYGPGGRIDFLGFRCVLGQESSIDRDDRVFKGSEAEPRDCEREQLELGTESVGTTFLSNIRQFINKKD